MTELTLDRLKSLLRYDADTGDFVWLVDRANGKIKAGSIAGVRVNKDRARRIIGIDGERIFAHRLAWFYAYGRWPTQFIDHINCDDGDNRLCNLREATPRQSSANTRIRQNNRSGRKGVVWRPTHNRWMAAIKVDGRLRYLGGFRSVDEAASAYATAARQIHGEFARTEGRVPKTLD